jgi:outer membrane protein
MFLRPTKLAGTAALCLFCGHGLLAAQPAPDALPPPEPAGSVTPAVANDGRAITGLSAAQLFDLADQARAAGRIGDAETIYKAIFQDPSLDIRSEARFRLGMTFADAGRFADAALAFRQLLDEQPGAARVRLELARVLALMGDEGRARQELRQAQASGLPPEVSQVVDRFAQALRSTKTFGGSFEFAMAPDSNINRATDSKVLDIPGAPLVLSEDAQARSGLGAHLAGQIYARLRLSPRTALVPRVSGDATLYGKSQFNDISASTAVGLELLLGSDRVTPSIGTTWRYYGGDLYARTTTLDLRWTHSLGRRGQLDSSFSWGNTSYLRNSLQDGELWNLGVSFERAFSARAGVGVSLNGQRQTARDAAYATASGGVTLVGWREMGKTTMFANATARRLEGDAGLILGFVRLPRRQEWFLRGLVGATFRQIEVAGFSPVARVAYERNVSTSPLYDYRRISVDVGITRAF